MKNVLLFEQFVNEKVYRLSGPVASTGIIGKLMQAFKKEIERIKYEGDEADLLEEVNKVWAKWASKDGAKIIIDEVLKAVKKKEEIFYIIATLNAKWKVESSGTYAMRFNLPDDFVINVGFMDDANGMKYARKLGGMSNSAISTADTVELMGTFDDEVGQNNIEIRGRETMMVDDK